MKTFFENVAKNKHVDSYFIGREAKSISLPAIEANYLQKKF